MDAKVVLGIHSHVSTETEGSFNQFVDGHAWISVNREGGTEFYGLWPDTHPNIEDNGPESDIRRGLESGHPAIASRYYELSSAQTERLETALSANIEWRYTNTCASWASETVEHVTGERVKADDVLGLETPRQLIESIRELERVQRTSPDTPRPPEAGAPSKSSLGSWSTEAQHAHENPLLAELSRRLSDPDRLQAWNDEVAEHRRDLDAQRTREDAELGRPAVSHGLVLS